MGRLVFHSSCEKAQRFPQLGDGFVDVVVGECRSGEFAELGSPGNLFLVQLKVGLAGCVSICSGTLCRGY